MSHSTADLEEPAATGSEAAADTSDAPTRGRPPGRWSRVPWPPLVLAAVAAAAAAIGNRILFPYFSGDADEPVYRFQALMLLDGHLTLPADETIPFFTPWLSGTYGDRVMLAFTWPWPAAMALSDLLTGSMFPAVAAAAAGATIAFWLFAGELIDDRRKVNLATALFTLCPFMLMLGATYLNYVFAVALQLTFAWMLLRGLRTRSQPWFVGAGTLWALALFARPYDGVLVALPIGVYLLVVHRHELRAMVRPIVLFAIGAAPVIALLLAANAATSGSPLTFPTTQQSGGAARFFFGERNVVENGFNPIDYDLPSALNSTRRNLQALPTWLVGSWLALVPIVYGGVRLWAADRRKLGLLIGMTVIWPVAYLFWFANALTAPGAQDGLGPHYYLPMAVPLALLAAIGLSALWAERRPLLLVGVALAVPLSYPALEPKISSKIEGAEALHEDYERQVREQVEALDGKPAIVVLEEGGYPVVMADHVYLSNRPDLTGPVLYAVDRGPDLADLLERHPDRVAFKIQRQLRPGGDITKPDIVLQPLRAERGDRVTVSATITNTSDKPHVSAFVRSGKRRSEVVLDTASERGRTYEITWTLQGDDGRLAVASEGTGADEIKLGERGELAVGASFRPDPDVDDPDRVERRYDFRVGPDDTVDLLTGEEEWSRIGEPYSAWLPLVVDDQLDVSVAAG